MDIPRPMEIYRHFKGGKYQIVCIAENSETGKQEVIYRAMYEPFKIYARDLDMFMSPVDREKYPEAMQANRFELYDGQENVANIAPAMKAEDNISDDASNMANNENEQDEANGKVSDASEAGPRHDIKPDADKSGISPVLLKFLDAEGADAQLECLSEIKDKLTPEILTPMEFSVGMEEAGTGSVMERYRNIKTHIMLKQKYERPHR